MKPHNYSKPRHSRSHSEAVPQSQYFENYLFDSERFEELSRSWRRETLPKDIDNSMFDSNFLLTYPVSISNTSAAVPAPTELSPQFSHQIYSSNTGPIPPSSHFSNNVSPSFLSKPFSPTISELPPSDFTLQPFLADSRQDLSTLPATAAHSIIPASTSNSRSLHHRTKSLPHIFDSVISQSPKRMKQSLSRHDSSPHIRPGQVIKPSQSPIRPKSPTRSSFTRALKSPNCASPLRRSPKKTVDIQSTISEADQDNIRPGNLENEPSLFRVTWETEGVECLQLAVNKILVTRRLDNNMINGTKMLNTADITRGKRDGMLKQQEHRIIIKQGLMPFKGVWITLESAKNLAEQANISSLLFPLLEHNVEQVVMAQGIEVTDQRDPSNSLPERNPYSDPPTLAPASISPPGSDASERSSCTLDEKSYNDAFFNAHRSRALNQNELARTMAPSSRRLTISNDFYNPSIMMSAAGSSGPMPVQKSVQNTFSSGSIKNSTPSLSSTQSSVSSTIRPHAHRRTTAESSGSIKFADDFDNLRLGDYTETDDFQNIHANQDFFMDNNSMPLNSIGNDHSTFGTVSHLDSNLSPGIYLSKDTNLNSFQDNRFKQQSNSTSDSDTNRSSTDLENLNFADTTEMDEASYSTRESIKSLFSLQNPHLSSHEKRTSHKRSSSEGTDTAMFNYISFSPDVSQGSSHSRNISGDHSHNGDSKLYFSPNKGLGLMFHEE
ncbi:hypothetical protein CANCADRAFT_31576 [Tortispora caseinolytica NRRL Y-17796]|uniref:HTH APSES-type domain-containing protein n=1 Tax=Tortispora caseinolytica NRRL Y-17796 TaxID=767744 RepID=A0A1E4TFZ8_9ASCO|nr:hypothetical protein CANCADRAFT_31576 [Tortispora caseinolytica NRRL Y-17796]